MLVLSWNLFLLVLITGPLAFGTAKLYGDLMAVYLTLFSKENFLSPFSSHLESTEESSRCIS